MLFLLGLRRLAAGVRINLLDCSLRLFLFSSRCWEKKMFGADVTVVSAFDDMPHLKPRGDSFELMEDDLSAFE